MPFVLVPFIPRKRKKPDATNGNGNAASSLWGTGRSRILGRRRKSKSRVIVNGMPARIDVDGVASPLESIDNGPLPQGHNPDNRAHAINEMSDRRSVVPVDADDTHDEQSTSRSKKLGHHLKSPRVLGQSIINALKKLSPRKLGKGRSFRIKNIFHFRGPKISIVFVEHNLAGEEVTVDQPTKLYTTYDEIRGRITILSKSECHVDNVEIALTGVTKTFVDKLSNTSAVSGRSEAIHRFLKLVQPVYNNQLPPNKILAAKQSYIIPFTFVVPSTLMPRACLHNVAGPHIKDLHLMLPPSLTEKGNQDGGSEQCKINYRIVANVTRRKKSNKTRKLCETIRRIRIRPANEEMPPLNVDGNETYCLRSEKIIKDGLLKGRTGALIVEAIQPKAFYLKPPGNQDPVGTSFVRLHLRYDPDTGDAIPPKLNTVATKLKISTHYATTARKDVPRKDVLDLTSDILTDVHTLANYSVASVEWKQHAPNTDQRNNSVVSFRRDSSSNFFASSTSFTSHEAENPIKPSTKYQDGAIFYTAQITVPVSLPRLPNKQFLPTFYTCLISRVYILQLALSLSGSPLAQPLRLAVPVQVAAESSAAGAERQRLAAIAEQAMIEAAHAFEPRVTGTGFQISDGSGLIVGARNLSQREQHSDLPPEYEMPGRSVARH